MTAIEKYFYTDFLSQNNGLVSQNNNFVSQTKEIKCQNNEIVSLTNSTAIDNVHSLQYRASVDDTLLAYYK